MSGDFGTPLDFHEVATTSMEALYALGSRLEDRGHDDSLELALVLVGRAVGDTIRELSATVAAAGSDGGELANALDSIAERLEGMRRELGDIAAGAGS